MSLSVGKYGSPMIVPFYSRLEKDEGESNQYHEDKQEMNKRKKLRRIPLSKSAFFVSVINRLREIKDVKTPLDRIL